MAVIGAGPAGLMAAERLASAGARVVVYERMPSPARKFLMAGRGGLNLTHSEALEPFFARYGAAAPCLRARIEAFGPDALKAWAEDLGQPLFTGTSGRVFPTALKASPLLRAWLARLDDLGVEVRTRWTWRGWAEDGALEFDTPGGPAREQADATVLALGGASWPRLGADGGWAPALAADGVALAPFRPANMGFEVAWSPEFAARHGGQPLKGVALTFDGRAVRGEAMVTAYGLEGGAVYARSAALRDALDRDGRATLVVDLKPDLTAAALAARLARPRGKASLSNHLRKAAGLAPLAIGLLREAGPLPEAPGDLAARIKAAPVALTAARGLDRAISSAGGIRLEALDERLMLRARPGVFAAGEMLDWEAPTGGYLLQACFATGVAAADGALAWLAARAS
ncbi:MAG TPA: TIGR03862 family flavoprotein [Caulobacteraceae bacterium]